MRRLLVLAATLALAGCGDDSTLAGDGTGAGKPRIVVSAASSLQAALTACAPKFADADLRLQFAGSDELAAQIRQGVPVDVFAAAGTAPAEALAAGGRLEEPVPFVANELVLAVPAGGRGVSSLEDLGRPGTSVVLGAEGVPVGEYARTVIERLGTRARAAVLANVRSEEPDVKGVVGKLVQGAADAGFVYATDVKASKGELEAIPIPAELAPDATYAAGVVSKSSQPDAAEAFLDDLLAGSCHEALIAAGFKEP